MVIVDKELLNPELYVPDDEGDGEIQFGCPLNPGLTDEEIADAQLMIPYVRGVMTITGAPGAGKDLFGHVFAWKIKRYFKDRHVMLDEKPKMLFGYYSPFDMLVMSQEFKKMNKIAQFRPSEEDMKEKSNYREELKEATDEFYNSDEAVKFIGAVVYLGEGWRYLKKKKIGKGSITIFESIMGIVRVWRHLDILLMCTAPRQDELDPEVMPYLTHEARCAWGLSIPDTTEVHIHKLKTVGSGGVVNVGARRPWRLVIDGAKSRPELGNKRYYDLYPSKSLVALGSFGKPKV